MTERAHCETCGWVGKSLKNHLASSLTCPDAARYIGGGQVVNEQPAYDKAKVEEQKQEEPPTSSTIPLKESPPPSPVDLGTFADALTKISTILSHIDQRFNAQNDAIETRLQKERADTSAFVSLQISQIGPAVAQYLREESTKEQAQTVDPSLPTADTPIAQGAPAAKASLLDTLLPLIAQKLLIGGGSGGTDGDINKLANSLESLGKLIGAVDNFRYIPWKQGVDFATQTILNQSRIGVEPASAAKQLQDNPPSWTKPAETPMPEDGK